MPTPFISGNVLGAQRPVKVNAARSAVRDVVKNWAGRTLRIHSDHDLQLAERVLAANEAELAEHSAHAPRLLASLRQELAKRA